MTKPTLYLMLGYPGAGKTTTAEIISELTGAIKLSSDLLRVHMFKQPNFSQAEHDVLYDTLDYLTNLLLSHGVSVIYDANLNQYQHRQDKYDIAKQTGAQAVLVWLQLAKEQARERAVLRGHHHLVPADETFEVMFDRVASKIEPPKQTEPFVAIEGAHITPEKIKSLLDI